MKQFIEPFKSLFNWIFWIYTLIVFVAGYAFGATN